MTNGMHHLPDMSIPAGGKEPNHWRYRANIYVPHQPKPDIGIGYMPLIKFFNNHLQGRDALTFWKPGFIELVTNFAIEDLSDESKQKIGSFAIGAVVTLGNESNVVPRIEITSFLGSVHRVLENWDEVVMKMNATVTPITELQRPDDLR
jgi:hypothetical protein